MNHFLKIILALLFVSTTAEAQINITFSGTSASVIVPESITDVTYQVNGADVIILSTNLTTEYTYTVSGSSSDGSLTINGSYKLTLRLNGVNLTNNHGGAAIDVECGKRIAVVLVPGTVNTLSDAALGAQKAAFYFSGHPEFEGSGTLNVRGKLKHAIASKEYMELKSDVGCINVLEAVSDGLHCGKGKENNEHNYFLMKGGTVNITNVGGDGVDADDYGVIKIEEGNLNINVVNNSEGLKADSILNVSGGNINIAVKGVDSDAMRANYAMMISGGNIDIVLQGDGTKGIKVKNETASTVNNGGNASISGGTIQILALGDSYTDATNETTKCIGVSIDADFTLTGGELHITAMGEEAKALNVKGTERIADDCLFTILSPWKVNPYDYQYNMTAYGIVKLNGTPLEDYANKTIGVFNGSVCIGIGYFDTPAYGTFRIYSNTATNSKALSFKLHDYDADYEYGLIPNQTVKFTSDGCVGMPSTPVVLSAEMDYYGDVNRDKTVTISDVVMMVNYILGNTSVGLFYELNADVNTDGIINISDVVETVNMILGNSPLRLRIGPIE